MSDDSTLKTNLPLVYIETPRTATKLEKIDALLEKRMREFLLERRRRIWREAGE